MARFSDLPEDIIKSHILTRLDGPALASLACCSSVLRRLSADDLLWINICRSIWPSTTDPNLSQLISTFPGGGARAFFSHAFPILAADYHDHIRQPSPPLPEIISAVDIQLDEMPIFTKVHTTQTGSAWFQTSPFRIDLLEPKEFVQIPQPDGACIETVGEMNLNWIMIDPVGRRAVDLSSQRPVEVERHWLTGEVHARYDTIVAGESGDVRCGITITCAGIDGGKLQVTNVSLEIEDTDGKRLNGKDSLGIIGGALEGKKGTGRNRAATARRRNKDYEEKRREMRENKLRAERSSDNLCLVLGAAIFLCLCFLIMYRS